jgi:hypothetical protein
MLSAKTLRLLAVASVLLFNFNNAYSQDAATVSTATDPTPLVRDVISDVNLFTGDFETRISLYALISRNGLNFPIDLAYDSDVNETAGALNKDKQASPYGLGWQLVIPYISTKMTDNDNNGQLENSDKYVEGSESNRLIYDIGTGQSKLENYRSWKITFISDAVGWEVFTEDGTKMKFGHRRHIVYRYYIAPYFLNTTFPYEHKSFKGYRWDLSEIEDVFGNTITFQYDDIIDYVTDCETLAIQLPTRRITPLIQKPLM